MDSLTKDKGVKRFKFSQNDKVKIINHGKDWNGKTGIITQCFGSFSYVDMGDDSSPYAFNNRHLTPYMDDETFPRVDDEAYTDSDWYEQGYTGEPVPEFEVMKPSGDGFMDVKQKVVDDLSRRPEITDMSPSKNPKGVMSDWVEKAVQKGRGGGIKYSPNKMRWRTLPLFLLKPIVKIFQYGAKKYKLHNWMGLSPDDLLDAVFRHLETHQLAMHRMWEEGLLADNNSLSAHIAHYMDKEDGLPEKMTANDIHIWGELFDDESNFPHIDHAITGLIMYRYQLVNGVTDLPEANRL